MKHGFYPASMSLSSARRAISLLLALVLLLSLSAPALAESDETDISAQDEILSAMTVYSWFTIAPLDVNGDVPAPDGGKYRVLDDELVSAETMQATMAAHFRTTSSMNCGRGAHMRRWTVSCTATPGESPYERPINPDISEVEYALALRTDEARIYTVTVYSLSSDEPLLFEFIQEKTEDNR